MKQTTLCYTNIVKLQILLNFSYHMHVKLEMLSNIIGFNGIDLFLRKLCVLGNDASMKLYIAPKNVPKILSTWSHRGSLVYGKYVESVESFL